MYDDVWSAFISTDKTIEEEFSDKLDNIFDVILKDFLK